jgi:hypothetical protein
VPSRRRRAARKVRSPASTARKVRGPASTARKVRSPAIATGAVSIAWGLVVTVGSYAVVRAVQHFVFTEPNPATLVWSAHAGFFWRGWTVAYAGGMAAFALLVAPHRSGLAARALATGVAIAASLLVLQAIFFP